jgi:hypothetical protein
MGNTSVSQDQQKRKLAMEMIISGQVSPNGRPGQVFVQAEHGLYLANSTACTCPDPNCPHILAANLYNRARHTVEVLLERRRPLWLPQIAWIIEDDLQSATDPALAEKLTLCLAVCQQMHREVLEASRNEPRFQSSYTVSLAGLTRKMGQNLGRRKVR